MPPVVRASAVRSSGSYEDVRVRQVNQRVPSQPTRTDGPLGSSTSGTLDPTTPETPDESEGETQSAGCRRDQ